MNHVTMLVGYVITDVGTVLLEHIVTTRATPVNMVKTVLFNVPRIAMEHVDTLTVRVQFVRQAGMVTDAMKHAYSFMEKTVDTNAAYTVTTRHVIDLTDDAFNVVQTDSMVNCVIKNL